MCVSSAYGFSLMSSNQWLGGELAAWAASLNTEYVLVVEAAINHGFSQHQVEQRIDISSIVIMIMLQRSEDGHGVYGRRCGGGAGGGAVMVPVHLYGQLAATRAGLELVLAQDTFWQMVARLGDASLQLGEDTSRLLGDTSRQLGDTGRQLGELGPAARAEQDWAGVKAAIWAVAHVATSPAASRWAEILLVSELK